MHLPSTQTSTVTAILQVTNRFSENLAASAVHRRFTLQGKLHDSGSLERDGASTATQLSVQKLDHQD
jgi:hypothetical protein